MVSLDGHPKQMLWWCYVKLGGHRRFAEVHRGRILTSTWSNAWGLFLLIRRTGALDSSSESGEDLNAQLPLLLSEIFPVFPSNSSVFNDIQMFQFIPPLFGLLLGCGLVCWAGGHPNVVWGQKIRPQSGGRYSLTSNSSSGQHPLPPKIASVVA